MRKAAILLFLIAVTASVGTTAFAQTDLRGWYADGQTWLVWENADPWPLTYDIYMSDAPFTDTAQAEWVGRIFPQDGRAPRLKIAYWFEEWHLPDGEGGQYTLTSNEALFVYTPHAEETSYFAVVQTGETAVGAENLSGPIEQRLDPVQCHLQRTAKTFDEQRPYSIYAHWVDGRDDWDAGRADYAVMGNKWSNGTGHVFAVWEPSEGRTGEPMPMVLGFHGGGESNYFNFGGNINPRLLIDTTSPKGLCVSIDDSMLVMKNTAMGAVVDNEVTRWFGYWEGFNRFEVPTEYPPNDGIVVDYSLRRVHFIVDWLEENEDIDPHRISLMGVSGGGGAVGFMTRWDPDRYSAVAMFVLPLKTTIFPYAFYMQGTADQNLKTNLPRDYGLTDWYWITNLLHDDREMPFMRLVMGKQDVLGPWEDVVLAFDQIEALRWGAHIYWDERDHIAHWPGTHWTGSERHHVDAMTRYRNDQSFPAFTNADTDPVTPGRQPDVGREGRESGDPWGTWGGYLDWDVDSIVDTPMEWSVSIFLFTDSNFENDVAPMDWMTADVTIRRAQEFRHAPGTTLAWSIDTDDGGLAGEVEVDDVGLVTIPQIPITKTARTLTVTFVEAPPDDDDIGDDDTDGGADDDAVDDDDANGPADESESDDDPACGC